MSERLFDPRRRAAADSDPGGSSTVARRWSSAASNAAAANTCDSSRSGKGPKADAPMLTTTAESGADIAWDGFDRAALPVSSIPAVNVATVPQRSPLRYPGGKTWLIPHVRAWLEPMQPRPKLLVEPFCGGAIVALTAAFEGLAERCLMAEIDHDVASFWHAALRHGPGLRELVCQFEPTRANVFDLADTPPRDLLAHGFRTLVLNRTRRGGILAAGAALARSGENNKGVASRWYPETLVRRLRDIEAHSERISFCEGDGLALLQTVADLPGAVAFVDPPYTAGGKRAGSRLYAHHALDHRSLFKTLAESQIEFLMTYDRAPQIVDLVGEFGFRAVEVVMKNTHHDRVSELVISRHALFE